MRVCYARSSIHIPNGAALAETGLAEWAANLPAENGDAGGLVDVGAGTAVRWVEGQGWVETTA